MLGDSTETRNTFRPGESIESTSGEAVLRPATLSLAATVKFAATVYRLLTNTQHVLNQLVFWGALSVRSSMSFVSPKRQKMELTKPRICLPDAAKQTNACTQARD